jgi:hypothetical protein
MGRPVTKLNVLACTVPVFNLVGVEEQPASSTTPAASKQLMIDFMISIVVWMSRKKQPSASKFYRPFQPDGITAEGTAPEISAAEADVFDLPKFTQDIERHPSVVS